MTLRLNFQRLVSNGSCVELSLRDAPFLSRSLPRPFRQVHAVGAYAVEEGDEGNREKEEEKGLPVA